MTRYLQSPLKWGLSSPLFCCFFNFFSFRRRYTQAPCLQCALWQQYKNKKKEETSRWSSCPGSCGDGSGVRTKTSQSLAHCLRFLTGLGLSLKRINHCIDFPENCCCYAGSVESGVAWWWDQETAEAGHLGWDQGKAEEEHTRSTWLWGKLFFCSDNMHTSQIVLFFTFSDSDSLVTTQPSWWDFFSVQLGTGSNVSKQHISTCRYKQRPCIPPPQCSEFRVMIAIGIKLFWKVVLLEAIVL